MTFHFLSINCIKVYLSIQANVIFIVYDLDALGVTQNIQIIYS